MGEMIWCISVNCTSGNMESVDILILSNGPGEITTWVRPVVKALRQQLGNDSEALLQADRQRVRISVILSPCPHATGKEAAIALSYPEVDRVQSSEHFVPFLLWRKTAENWDWRPKGVVIFLGGDQVFPLIIGKYLGYKTFIYVEWMARWYQWIDRYGVMNASVIEKIPPRYKDKCTVVGDLMADISPEGDRMEQTEAEIVALLPGSKAGKLAQGVPFCLAIAEHIHQQRPQTQFILPVAPTLDLPMLAQFANPQQNPMVAKMQGTGAELILPTTPEELPFLKTAKGVQVKLVTQFPAHDWLRQCRLALTTAGANTAELGALGIPMIVLLPTQQLDAMRTWDGLPGMLARLPGIGSIVAKKINQMVLKQGRLFAWPNIWAKEEIVPELVGELKASEVAMKVLELLEHPKQLEKIRERLGQARGKTGAAAQIAQIVTEQLNFVGYN